MHRNLDFTRSQAVLRERLKTCHNLDNDVKRARQMGACKARKRKVKRSKSNPNEMKKTFLKLSRGNTSRGLLGMLKNLVYIHQAFQLSQKEMLVFEAILNQTHGAYKTAQTTIQKLAILASMKAPESRQERWKKKNEVGKILQKLEDLGLIMSETLHANYLEIQIIFGW